MWRVCVYSQRLVSLDAHPRSPEHERGTDVPVTGVMKWSALQLITKALPYAQGGLRYTECDIFHSSVDSLLPTYNKSC